MFFIFNFLSYSAEIIARLGVYQVSSSDTAHLSLLPFALSSPADASTTTSGQKSDKHSSGSVSGRFNAEAEASGSRIDTKPRPSIESLKDSLFLITLDWEAPWTFLSQLVEWLDVVQDIIQDATNTSKGSWSRERVIWEGMKDSLESFIRLYSDPSGPLGMVSTDEDEVGETSVASAIVPVSNPVAAEEKETSPLPEGCLTHNFGVPLVVVCTKADTIPQLERDRNFKEETFDYVQQVLRTICLKCEFQEWAEDEKRCC